MHTHDTTGGMVFSRSTGGGSTVATEGGQRGSKGRTPARGIPWTEGLPESCSEALWGESGSRVLEYVRGRGFDDQTIRDHGLGALHADGADWLVIPLRDPSGVTVNVKCRRIPNEDGTTDRPKYRCCSGRPMPLFGGDRLPDDRACDIIIVEGELDAIALYQYGFEGVVTSTSGAGSFAEDWLDLLEPYSGFIIAYDDDKAGQKGAAELVSKLGDYRCSVAKLKEGDPADCLSAGVPGDKIELQLKNAASMVGLEIVHIAELAPELERKISRPDELIGRPTGSAKMDATIAGIRPGLIILSGESGIGKAQPVDEPVLTPAGWAPIGSLRPGDLVYGSSGHPVRVDGVYPQGVRHTCDVRFSDGSIVRCDWDHLWSVRSDLDAHRRRPWRTKTTREILASIDRGRSRRWRVPVPGRIEYADQEVSLHPYILGVLIGDGSLTSGLKFYIANGDESIISEVESLLPGGHRLTIRPDKRGCSRCVISTGDRGGQRTNDVLEALRKMGIYGKKSAAKFIPEDYLKLPVDGRLSLLQGLMDTDGWVQQGSPYFGTSSPRLAGDFCSLIRSLGGTVSVGSKTPKYRYKGELKTGLTAYTVAMNLPADLHDRIFRLERKSQLITGKRFGPVKKIVSVEPGPPEECVCISVEAEDSLYVTSGYTLTHNTTFAVWLFLNQARLGIPSLLSALEQSPVGVLQKVLRAQMGDDFTASPYAARKAAYHALEKLPLDIIKHRGHIKPDELTKAIKYAVRRKGVRNILIDHLGFIMPDHDDSRERQAIEKVVRELSILGEHEGCSIFLVVHPSNADAARRRRVGPEHLKGASAIRQDAHEIWIVEKSAPTKKRPWPATWVHFDKVRSDFASSGSKVLLAFDPLACVYADSWESTPSGQKGILMQPQSTAGGVLRRGKK